MSKLTLASDLTTEAFKTVIDGTYLSHCTWAVLNNPKLKPSSDGMFSRVKISGEDLVLTGARHFLIVINEDLFDRLSDEHQTMFVMKTLAQIGYDTEKGVCSKVKPDYVEYGSIIKKWGYENLEAFKLSVSQEYEKYKEVNS